jgi:hypothetical protein
VAGRNVAGFAVIVSLRLCKEQAQLHSMESPASPTSGLRTVMTLRQYSCQCGWRDDGKHCDYGFKCTDRWACVYSYGAMTHFYRKE